MHIQCLKTILIVQLEQEKRDAERAVKTDQLCRGTCKQRPRNEPRMPRRENVYRTSTMSTPCCACCLVTAVKSWVSCRCLMQPSSTSSTWGTSLLKQTAAAIKVVWVPPTCLSYHKSYRPLNHFRWQDSLFPHTAHQPDEDMLCRALLQYHNTPSRKDGFSPAQKLYGRPVQDTPSPQTVIRNGQNRTVHQGGGRSLIQQTCTRPTWCWTRVKRHHTKSKN